MSATLRYPHWEGQAQARGAVVRMLSVLAALPAQF
jgi:hypothetical protein